MTPRFPADRIPHRGATNAVLFSQTLLGYTSACVGLSYVLDLLFRELRSSVSNAFALPIFFVSVHHVLSVVPYKNVARIHTPHVVARVAREKPFRDRASESFVHNPMRIFGHAVYVNAPIAGTANSRRDPNPTTVFSYLDFLHNSLYSAFSHMLIMPRLSSETQ